MENTTAPSKLKGLRDIRRKSIDLGQIDLVKTSTLGEGQKLPLIIQPTGDNIDLADWAQNNRELIEEYLLKHGGLLFRGFNLGSPADFEKVALAIYGELYGGYGDLPRAGTSDKIYQSTPYPPDKPILFHSESSHLESFPMKISFFCVQKAQEGGITPLLDNRAICSKIDPEIFAKFEEKGLMYIRTFLEGIDVPWRDFFHTDDKAKVEEVLREAGIDFEWLPNDGLQMRTLCDAVIKHPKTGETLFFNQIQLHHIACLDRETRDSLIALYGAKYLPRNVYYGDGTEIPNEVVDYLGELYEKEAIRADWEEGDMIVLDNMITSHARDPYVGPRRIVVAMGQMRDRTTL